MSLTYKRDIAHLGGQVTVEDAEGLLNWLLERPAGKVNLRQLEHLHAANLQVLMALRPRISAWPRDPDLNAWLRAALHY